MSLRRPSLIALAAAAWVAAVDLFYLIAVHGQGSDQPPGSRVIFVAACLAAAAFLTALGVLLPAGLMRAAVFGCAGFMLLCWAVLGAASIGLLLAVPALLVLRSAWQAAGVLGRSRAWFAIVSTAALDLVVVVLGLAATS